MARSVHYSDSDAADEDMVNILTRSLRQSARAEGMATATATAPAEEEEGEEEKDDDEEPVQEQLFASASSPRATTSPDPIAFSPSPAPPSAKGTPVPALRVSVEVPFVPLTLLARYAHARGVAHPTHRTRQRVLELQDIGNEPTRRVPARAAAVMATRHQERARSTPSAYRGFGGSDIESEQVDYVDDGEVELESEGSGSASDGSDLGIRRRATRGLAKQTRQTRQTRATWNTRPDTDSDSDMVPRTRRQSRAAAASSSNKKRKTRGRRDRSHSTASHSGSNASYNPFADEGEDEIEFMDEDDELEQSPTPPPGPKRLTREILSYHRNYCEKCHDPPADEMLAKARKKKRGRKRKDEDELSDGERAESLQGWLECERCVVSYHWGCLGDNHRRDVLTAFSVRFPHEPPRKSVAIDEVAAFTCSRCEAYPVCFVCKEEKLPDVKADTKGDDPDAPIEIDSDDEPEPKRISASVSPSKRASSVQSTELVKSARPDLIPGPPAPLLFRCFRCKQAAHYEHLASPFAKGEKYTLPELANDYQLSPQYAWFCHCCREWIWLVDRIIAWRPLPADAVEPPRPEGEKPRFRDRLPREYLVKWSDRGFRHATWVPHAWVLAISPQKLNNFLTKGPMLDLVTDESLAMKGDEMTAPTITDVINTDTEESDRRYHGEADALEAKWEGHGPPPDVSAQTSLPIAWSSVDRLLEIYLMPPKVPKASKKKQKGRQIVESSDEDQDDDDYSDQLEDGMQPPNELMVETYRWENLTGRNLVPDDAEEIAPLVTWCFVKWDDLQYDQCCWDTPPPKDSPLYPAFLRALRRYLAARQVEIPILGAQQVAKREREAAERGDPPQGQPECVVGGTLMPFQVEGLQWLLYKHFRRESCILADDMGLGKTIQVSSFIGYLVAEGIYPSLVIVPNSTITNWVREFEKWVPHVRVVPYHGDAASRKNIGKYELYHPGFKGKAEGLKAHVVLTTYETITGNDFRIFSNVPRWEALVVDEGQRIKSDSSLMFARLKQLNTVHRVLLTGTPLNNNLRELFNLLNFLDEPNFRYLADLEARFENLSEGLVQELHEMIKPYILRRIKADVLKLPPKVEIIVPISCTPAQKMLMKRILHRHADTINNILHQRKKKKKAKEKGKEAVITNGSADGEGAGTNAAGATESTSGGPANGSTSSDKPVPAANGTDGASTATGGSSGAEVATAAAGDASSAPVTAHANGAANGSASDNGATNAAAASTSTDTTANDAGSMPTTKAANSGAPDTVPAPVSTVAPAAPAAATTAPGDIPAHTSIDVMEVD